MHSGYLRHSWPSTKEAIADGGWCGGVVVDERGVDGLYRMRGAVAEVAGVTLS